MTSSTDQADAQRTTEAVLRRDRRRIRALAILTIGLWVLAALLIPSVYLPLGAKVKQLATLLDAVNPGAADVVVSDNAATEPVAPVAPEDVPAVLARVQHQTWIVGQIVYHQWIIGAIILTFALAAGILASVASVALALTIRRVTLRQVASSLAQISEQLRDLQRTSRPEAAR